MSLTLAYDLRRQFGKPEGWLGRVAGWIMAWRPSNRDRNRWTVGLLGLRPTDRVLEIGHGPGFAAGLAAEQVPQGMVVGLDHSAVMHAQASARNAAFVRQGRMVLVQGGFEGLAAFSEPFDKVFAVNVFQFLPDRGRNPEIHCECGDFPGQETLPDRPQALRAVKSAMKPGGTLAVTYMPRHANAVPQDAERFAAVLAREMADAGYPGVRIEKLDLKPIPAVCVLGTA